MKILVTGFTPFGGEKINPAYEAVKRLPAKINGVQVITAELPTVFGSAAEVLEELMGMHNPAAVICVGQAGGRAAISLERVAVNLRDARIPDNEGNSPRDEPIKADAENAYFSNLPNRAIVNALREHGIPATLSYTAGTYVCNDVLYHLLYWIEKKYPQVLGGFIHVPYDPAQAAAKPSHPPSMSIATTAEALNLAVLATAEFITS